MAELKSENERLKIALNKFTVGSSLLDKVIAAQRPQGNRYGFDYSSQNVPSKKIYQTHFVKSTRDTFSRNENCFHCHTSGHISKHCSLKNDRQSFGFPRIHLSLNIKDVRPIKIKSIWVPKGHATNIIGPKQIWVPKYLLN